MDVNIILWKLRSWFNIFSTNIKNFLFYNFFTCYSSCSPGCDFWPHCGTAPTVLQTSKSASKTAHNVRTNIKPSQSYPVRIQGGGSSSFEEQPRLPRRRLNAITSHKRKPPFFSSSSSDEHWKPAAPPIAPRPESAPTKTRERERSPALSIRAKSRSLPKSFLSSR